MSERKQTPDVLSDLLSTGSTPDAVVAPPAAAAAPGAARKPAARKSTPVKETARPAVTVAQTPDAPPQWEYREVIFREFRGWRPRYIDGRERWDWKEAPLMLDYLRQAGDEGWELVSVGEVHKYQKTAYFKRPKAP